MTRRPSPKSSAQGQHKPNWANRTVFQCDDLEALRGMDTATVDLIVTEAPRFKIPGFRITQEKIYAGASFQDRWAMGEDVHQAWLEEIQGDLPEVWQIIQAARVIHGPGMEAFLCFLGVRLIEMHRVLRPTGSIYLHCDHAVSHYLKLLMDAIFGNNHFRNEIAWCYGTAGKPKKAFPKGHDVLLFYARSKDVTFNLQYIPYSDEKRRVIQARRGDRNKIKQLLERGAPVLDWWDDIIPIASRRSGLPLRQPIALYERAIRASSNEGDMVLDPFCRHPLILMAAEHLKRQWTAISLWGGWEGPREKGVVYSEEPPERTDR